MALINQGGALLLQGGALASGAACCCGKCSGPCPNGVADCATGCGCSSGQCVPCQGACDEENPCPEGCYCCNGQCIGGCPDFSGCRIRVYEDYGDFQIERINTLVSDLQINGCDIPILIQDIATESCGDVSGTATVGYDEACNCPVIVSTSNLGGRPDFYPDCQPLPLVVELLNCPNCCTGPCDGENPCPEGCACVNGECVDLPCEDCTAKLNAGEYALDVEYPDMTIPPANGDISYGGFYFLRELGCEIAIDARAACGNDFAPEGPYFHCGCGKTWTWTVGCDQEGGPVITGSSADGEWGNCGCDLDGGSFSEGPSNPLLCNPRTVTAPKPTVSIRKLNNPLP